jgi:RNA polymerase sigma factor (TIGR02999 family)
MADVTRILKTIEQGDPRATEELIPFVYDELRLIAAQKLSKEPPGQTLQATALVHEAYIRLTGAESQGWGSRGHFFTAAAEAMRRILVENARRRNRLKRGGDHNKVDLEDATLAIEAPSDNIVALDEALTKLAEHNKAIADVVKLRYFAGLSLEQISEIIGVSRRTVSSYWAYARAWLYREITGGGSDNS